MALTNTHFYLVKNGELAYPSEFQEVNIGRKLNVQHQFTKWGFWLPFNRSSIDIETILEYNIYSSDSADIAGIMINSKGQGLWLEVSGEVLCVNAIRLNHEFDIKTMVTGVPDAFKTVSHINPALSAVKMIATVAEIIPIRAIDPICYNLDALYDEIGNRPEVQESLGDFMQNIRNFHADYCELNRQFSLKLRVNQGGVN